MDKPKSGDSVTFTYTQTATETLGAEDVEKLEKLKNDNPGFTWEDAIHMTVELALLKLGADLQHWDLNES